MTEFVPNGYVSMREALNRVGSELFPADWSGKEHEARRGLMSEDEWLRIKDLTPPSGGGSRGSDDMERSAPPPPKLPPHAKDPSHPAYQEEYRARRRHVEALDQLRRRLEGGDLEAAILDPFSGILHPVSASLWRQHSAARAMELGQAPVPNSHNTGQLLVKRFAESDASTKPMPRAKIQEAIEALKEKTAAESLTRAQQKDFVRKTFPGLRVTERQFIKIFQEVDVPIGRPRKSKGKP